MLVVSEVARNADIAVGGTVLQLRHLRLSALHISLSEVIRKGDLSAPVQVRRVTSTPDPNTFEKYRNTLWHKITTYVKLS